VAQLPPSGPPVVPAGIEGLPSSHLPRWAEFGFLCGTLQFSDAGCDLSVRTRPGIPGVRDQLFE
jgi:hypothetical protein